MKAAVQIFLTALFETYICIKLCYPFYMSPAHVIADKSSLEHPGNFLDFKALSCSPAHSTCKVQYVRQLIRRTHGAGCTGGAGSPLTVISPSFQCHVHSTLKPRLPKYTLRPMKHLISHQILGMESEGLY